MQAMSLPTLLHSGFSGQRVAFLVLEIAMTSEEISDQAE